MILAGTTDNVDFSRVGVYLNDPANWWGPNGLLIELRTHVYYTLVAVIVAMIIALPIGLLIGHTGRGAGLVGALANGLRAVPALGLMVFLVIWLAPKINWSLRIPQVVDPGKTLQYFLAFEIALVVLAIPPILVNTYAGVQNVDPAVRDAARGMGMTGRQVMLKVELPNALPLIMSGIRSATLQVIATAIIAGYVPFGGGLGVPIIAGPQSLGGYPQMVAAAIVVAALALVADFLLVGLQRLIVSRGVTGKFSRRAARRARAATLPEVELAKA